MSYVFLWKGVKISHFRYLLIFFFLLKDKKNSKFGIQAPQNPISGLYQGCVAGFWILALAIIQLICLPFTIISSVFEKFADGLRWGEFYHTEKSYDDIDGFFDGIREGWKSLYYGLRAAFVWNHSNSCKSVFVNTIGIITRPLGGFFDAIGKFCEGLLRCFRVKQGRHHGQLSLTKNQQDVVKKQFAEKKQKLKSIKEE